MADVSEREHTRAAAIHGAMAGVLGAIVMALLMMMVTAGQGGGFWTPLQLIGGVAFGSAWQSLGSALLGAVIHLIVGAIVGAIYGLLTRRIEGTVYTTMLGMVFGIAVFAPATYLILPAIDPVMYGTMHLGVLFMAHIVYGLITGAAVGALRHKRSDVAWPRVTRSVGPA